MAKWTAFPGTVPTLSIEQLKKHWDALHKGDCEAFPKDRALQEGWRLFHVGDFYGANKAGLAAGELGISLANLSANIYANYLEKKDATRVLLFRDVMVRAEAHQSSAPQNPNA